MRSIYTASLEPVTTNSSFPQSSITFTAIRDLSVLARFEGCTRRSGQVIPHAFLMGGLQCLLDAAPGRGAREEHLRAVEDEAVIVGIQHPHRDIGRLLAHRPVKPLVDRAEGQALADKLKGSWPATVADVAVFM